MNPFKAARCSQCGGALDVSKLHCPSCGTDFVIDWQSVVGNMSTKRNKFFDRTIEAVILAAVQAMAIKEGVEVDFALSDTSNTSSIRVMVKDTTYSSWKHAATIHCYQTSTGANGMAYHISAGSSYSPDHVAYRLDWEGRRNGVGRFYTLRQDSLHSYSTGSHYQGENELFRHLACFASVAIAEAKYWQRRKAEEKAAKAAHALRKNRSLLYRIFG